MVFQRLDNQTLFCGYPKDHTIVINFCYGAKKGQGGSGGPRHQHLIAQEGLQDLILGVSI